MGGMRHLTDPEMFKRFHTALTSERAGYTPWYFLLSKGLKDPVAGISWKQLEGRLTFEQALKKMRAGHNIGIAATGMDALCIVDVDDITATPDEIVKPTLSTRSRKRIGRHYFYFTEDPRCKENLPTESKGEIRSNFEYVVAPGSFVLCDDKTIAAMPEAQRGLAGRYTVENERAPDTIVFEELPPVFLEQAKKNSEAEREAKKRREAKAKACKEKKPEQGGNKNRSAIWDLSIDDIWNIPNKTRFKSLFHASTTGKNTSLNDSGGLTCWRHLVTHTPLSSLCVMAGVADCNEAGKAMKGGAGGDSSIDYKDGKTIFKMWSFAKKEGLIPKTDPIPWKALNYFAIDAGICSADDMISGWKLPRTAHNRAIEQLEKDGIPAGREKRPEPKPGEIIVIYSTLDLREYISGVKRTIGDEGQFTFTCNGRDVTIQSEDIFKLAVWKAALIDCNLLISFSLRTVKNQNNWTDHLKWFINGSEETTVLEMTNDDMTRTLIVNKVAELIPTDEDARFRINDATCKIVDGVRIVKWKSLEMITKEKYTGTRLYYILKPVLAKTSDQQRIAGERISLWYFKENEVILDE